MQRCKSSHLAAKPKQKLKQLKAALKSQGPSGPTPSRQQLLGAIFGIGSAFLGGRKSQALEELGSCNWILIRLGAMLHSVVATARMDTAATTLEGAAAPGILTAKTLQSVLQSARQQNANHEEEPGDEIVSPYGKMPRQARKNRYRHRSNDSVLLQARLRFKHDFVTRHKRWRKLDPMPTFVARSQIPSNMLESLPGNQMSAGEAPDAQHLDRLRSGLMQTSSKLQRDADRLKNEIQWIHGHFPVLKLANTQCSRPLRQQLFRNALVHVSVNFVRRKALLVWYNKLLDAQRKERLQLSASRQLIVMFEKISFDRIAGKFNAWQQLVQECQTQEIMSAAITLQRFAKFIQSRRQNREAVDRQMALMTALQELTRKATTIQIRYRRHCRAMQQRRCEASARNIQRIAMRRIAHNEFIKRLKAAKLLQRSYRAHVKRFSRSRAQALAHLLDRSREKQARRIQSAWLAYKSWRDSGLPVEVVQTLVDQVEFLDAVLSIQRHLRGFQCRFRLRKKNSNAVRIQRCWRAGRCRVTSRAERRMVHLRRDMAASCLKRTFRRKRDERKIRSIVHQSARPLYLRARHLGDSFREQFRLPIAKSAIVVIQTIWRRHLVHEREKQRKLVAATTIQSFLRRGAISCKWRSSVFGAHHHRQDDAARTLQRWMRNCRNGSTKSTRRRASVVYVLEQISAATNIQRWYRHRRHDMWRVLFARLLAKELPRCVEAVNRIVRCWRVYSSRKKEQTHRASTIADLIERQRHAEVESRSARFIQRTFKRMIDRRDGKLLLHRYRILLRGDLKRRQQRVIVHKFLEEKSQQRKKKEEVKALTRRVSVKSSIGSPQILSLDSCATEASAFSLDESSYYASDEGWHAQSTESASPQAEGSVQYWSEEYQRAYLYDPLTGVSTWL